MKKGIRLSGYQVGAALTALECCFRGCVCLKTLDKRKGTADNMQDGGRMTEDRGRKTDERCHFCPLISVLCRLNFEREQNERRKPGESDFRKFVISEDIPQLQDGDTAEQTDNSVRDDCGHGACGLDYGFAGIGCNCGN